MPHHASRERPQGLRISHCGRLMASPYAAFSVECPRQESNPWGSGLRVICVTGSVYGQGAQHRFLGPMCCDVHKRHSPSRAHIWGGGESGLDPRGVQPPHVALTPSRAPQDLPPSPGFQKKRYQYRQWPRAHVAAGRPDSGRRWHACK